MLEIMDGAVQKSKLDVPILFHEGRAAGRRPGSVPGARASGVQEPERGLT